MIYRDPSRPILEIYSIPPGTLPEDEDEDYVKKYWVISQEDDDEEGEENEN